MATGPKHWRTTSKVVMEDESQQPYEASPCRCTIGHDHDDKEMMLLWHEDMSDDDEDDDSGESLSASDAADIWRSNGMDEDYTFGYSEDELRNA